MGKSGERKNTFSFRNLFRWCKGKGNADDDRHAYQKQPLHNQTRRSDRELRDNTSIEEHYELKEYRKPHDIEPKRDDKNDAPNSQNILYEVTQNVIDNDTTEVTKVHVEPLNRNSAIKSYKAETSDAKVEFAKDVPDDDVDCANSYPDIQYIDEDVETGDVFENIESTEAEIKEKNNDKGQDILIYENHEWSVIETVSPTNEVRNQETLNSDNDLVAFMDTKTKIDDLNTYRETEGSLSIAQNESPLNNQDNIADTICEPDVPYTTTVDKDQIQVEETFQETANRSVEIVESTGDVVLLSVPTIYEDDVDDENIKKANNDSFVIVENIDDLAAEGDQTLNKDSDFETSSQTDNENTDDEHAQATHDKDSKSDITTFRLNEGSNMETFSQAENEIFDNVPNLNGTYDVVSKPDHVTDADSYEDSDNEQFEETNTDNDGDQIEENTKHIYHNSFDDDDDNQHIYNAKIGMDESSKHVVSSSFYHDNDDDSDFESGQEQFQETSNWYQTGGATGGHPLSKVFKADQNEFRQNIEEVTLSEKLDQFEPTISVERIDHTGKTPPKEDLPEITLPDKSDNVLFYQNKIKSRPPIGHTIEDMLKWMGDYAFLEKNHSYIQWLFPIPGSSGMNYQAQALQDHEIEIMKNDEDIQGRVIRSFRMMLDFYGMEMVDDMFQRNERNWQARYAHLNQSFHNRMRITRIIQSLGELGFTKIQTRWLSFLMQEAMVNKSLNRLGGDSMQYFIDAIKEDDDRHKLYETYFRYMMGDFSEPQDNDEDTNDKNVEDENGEFGDDKSDENSDSKNSENVEVKNCETFDSKNDANVDGESNDYGDVSNGCDYGDTDEVNANVMQGMSADDDKTEKDRSDSIMSSENADNDMSDDYSTAEEETDKVYHTISESENHAQEGVRTNHYEYGLSNDAQNADLLPSSVTLNTNCDTPITEIGNIQTHNTDDGTTETKKNDKTQEKEEHAGEKFEIQSIGSYDDDTDITITTSDMKDDTKDEHTDSESNDKTIDTITRNDSFKDKDDSVYETKDEDAYIDSETEPDDSNGYLVFCSTDGTIKH